MTAKEEEEVSLAHQLYYSACYMNLKKLHYEGLRTRLSMMDTVMQKFPLVKYFRWYPCPQKLNHKILYTTKIFHTIYHIENFNAIKM